MDANSETTAKFTFILLQSAGPQIIYEKPKACKKKEVSTHSELLRSRKEQTGAKSYIDAGGNSDASNKTKRLNMGEL